MTGEDLVILKSEMEFGPLLAGNVIPYPGANDDGAPRFLASRHAGGTLYLYRQDVPEDVRAQLAAVEPASALADDGAVRKILARLAPCEHTWHGCWYRLDRAPSAELYRDAVPYEDGFAILVDGTPASIARSEKRDGLAEEVRVDTDESYRGRGYATQVVAAWLADVLSRNKLAIYSHRFDNDASRAIARRLGGLQFSEEMEYA